MISAWIFWWEFWLAVMSEPPDRPTARIYRLDDYRVAKPLSDGPTNEKPPRRAA